MSDDDPIRQAHQHHTDHSHDLLRRLLHTARQDDPEPTTSDQDTTPERSA